MMSSDTDIPPPLRPVQRRRRPFATPRAVVALVLREMSTRYGNSPGGYVWAVLEPLGAILVLSIAFSLVIRTPSLGNSFLLFYATGYMPLTQFLSTSNMVSGAIGFSKPLLKYPSVTWVDAVTARLLLTTLTDVMVMYILFTGILMFQDTRTIIDLVPIVSTGLLTAGLAFGVGTVNCALFGLFPVWQKIWGIATRPLFIASGVFFLYEDLPPLAQDILWYNPVLHLTGLMRTGFYPTYNPTYISQPFVLIVSMVLIAAGLLLLKRFNRDILNR